MDWLLGITADDATSPAAVVDSGAVNGTWAEFFTSALGDPDDDEYGDHDDDDDGENDHGTVTPPYPALSPIIPVAVPPAPPLPPLRASMIATAVDDDLPQRRPAKAQSWLQRAGSMMESAPVVVSMDIDQLLREAEVLSTEFAALVNMTAAAPLSETWAAPAVHAEPLQAAKKSPRRHYQQHRSSPKKGARRTPSKAEATQAPPTATAMKLGKKQLWTADDGALGEEAPPMMAKKQLWKADDGALGEEGRRG